MTVGGKGYSIEAELSYKLICACKCFICFPSSVLLLPFLRPRYGNLYASLKT